MNAVECIVRAIEEEGSSTVQVSLGTGHNKTFVSTLVSKRRDALNTKTLVSLADYLGYDVVLRSRENESEFIINE